MTKTYLAFVLYFPQIGKLMGIQRIHLQTQLPHLLTFFFLTFSAFRLLFYTYRTAQLGIATFQMLKSHMCPSGQNKTRFSLCSNAN